MNWKALLTIFFFLGSLLLVQVVDADAARFGGGKSFGSKPSMSQSAPAGALGSKAPTAGAAAGAAAKKPGMLGGMGGMLGGLLAGTLLGSLLFGGGFSGGGFMDILLIGILLFVAYKLFTRFRGAQQPTPATASAGRSYTPPPPPQEDVTMRRQEAAQGWGALQDAPVAATNDTVTVPEGFDTEEFLRGAKMAFTRLQASWDRRDLQDIAQFTSPAVQEEARSQFAQDPKPGRTEILLVNAQLTGVTESAQEQTASVYFDVLLREAPSTESTQVREIWHFTRALTGNQSWKLDGIQQVE